MKFNEPANAKIKAGFRPNRTMSGKPRRKFPKRMTQEELQQASIEYPERIKVLESKKASNGGLGLMPDNAAELQALKGHLKIIAELLENDSKVI